MGGSTFVPLTCCLVLQSFTMFGAVPGLEGEKWGFGALAEALPGGGGGGEQVAGWQGWREPATGGKEDLERSPRRPVSHAVAEADRLNATELVMEDGEAFSPSTVSSPDRQPRRLCAGSPSPLVRRASADGRVLRPPHRRLVTAVRGLDFGHAEGREGRARAASTPKAGEEVEKDFRQELMAMVEAGIREKMAVLECPVCLETATSPIYSCPEAHVLCSTCLPRLERCGVCRTDLRSSAPGQAVVRRHRWAETVEGELLGLLAKKGQLEGRGEAR